MKKELKKSVIQFIAESHKYLTPDGKELSGITKMIKDLVFPDKYKDVPEDVLKEAAERGTLIHNLCEEFAINGTVTEFMPDEVASFVFLTSGKDKINFTHAEYLVSDGEHFATQIDLIDDNLNLYDIKTTSTLDIEYLSWQLSTAACLFEMQNPGVEIGKLYAIWLRNDRCEIREVVRYHDSAIEALMTAWVDGTEFVNPMKAITREQETQLAEIAEMESRIISLEEAAKELKRLRDGYTSKILSEMVEKGIKSLETDNVKITVKAAHTRQSVDGKKLQEKHPEIYNECLKSSNVKESLLITLKNK